MQGLVTLRARARTLLTLCFLLALSPLLAQDPPLPFACEVRFHFREQFPEKKAGQKHFSAPSNEREALPTSRFIKADGSRERIVEGTVPHLPYHFLIKVSESDNAPKETLEVNVLNSAGEPPHFPKADDTRPI